MLSLEAHAIILNYWLNLVSLSFNTNIFNEVLEHQDKSDITC